MALKILLADDHEIVRTGLKALLEQKGYQVVAEAANGHEAVRLTEKTHPDLAVLDLTMPLLNGIDAARELAQTAPKVPVILLTMHTEEQYILDALRAGARGYVLKSEAATDLVSAIEDVSRGVSYLSPRVSRAVVQAYLNKSNLPDDRLTSRERQVLQLVAEGKYTDGTAALVRYAIRRGIIEP